jgi:hypothetical protein
MTHSALSLREQVLLSMQRALLGMITADIRGVEVSWQDQVVRANFIYDRVVDDAAWEIVREVETEVIADLATGVLTEFDARHVPIDASRDLLLGGCWVYLRRE